MNCISLVFFVTLLTVGPTLLTPRVTFERNGNDSASSSFRFKTISQPIKDDIAAKATLTLVDGEMDQGSGDLSALTDGRLPTEEDEPGSNCFFSAGSFGGRFRMDFGIAVEITEVNSYSWHPNSRGPQLYKLYGSDGTDAKFNLSPRRGLDPAAVGWKEIATVSTIPATGEDGGQYGVSVTDSGGSLGKYRYLLFDCYPTELNDDWGNTFYSEIDVIGKSSSR